MIITVSSIKGGVGKSSLVILAANNLAARGNRVLVIDMDLNNSVTFYYTLGLEGASELCDNRNIVMAITQERLKENVIETRRSNVYLLPSSLSLCDIRAIDYRKLKKLLSKNCGFDYVIIDTSPTYDNLVMSAIYAADYILTPVDFAEFNFNMTSFLMKKIQEELPEKYGNTFIVFAHYLFQFDECEGGEQKDYMQLYYQAFASKILAVKLPHTSYVKKYTDRDELVSINSRESGKVRLAEAVNQLINMFTGEKDVVERF